jgi:hypothetical protein
MNTPRYFVLPGRFNSGALLLIKFDPDRNYWIWDRINQDWIPGTPLFEVHWLNGHLTRVVEEEGKQMIEQEARNRVKFPIPDENVSHEQDAGREHGMRTAPAYRIRNDS